MTLTGKRPRRYGYDWQALAAAARTAEGEWMCEDDGPGVSAYDIRHGNLPAFRPPGAYDARLQYVTVNRETREKRYSIYVRFLGYPLVPWAIEAGDPRTFDELRRVTDANDPSLTVPWHPDRAWHPGARTTPTLANADHPALADSRPSWYPGRPGDELVETAPTT